MTSTAFFVLLHGVLHQRRVQAHTQLKDDLLELLGGRNVGHALVDHINRCPVSRLDHWVSGVCEFLCSLLGLEVPLRSPPASAVL